MKIADVITAVDELRPNTFSEKQKVQWLAELDGKVGLEIMRMSIEDVEAMQYQHPADLETTLLVRFPHDGIYSYYLTAMIDCANGEVERYANSSAMFNAAWNDLESWFVQYYDPAQGYWRVEHATI